MIKGVDIEALQRLCDVASKGPWQARNSWIIGHCVVGAGDDQGLMADCFHAADAAFIAAARTALPEALEEIRRQSAEILRLQNDLGLRDARERVLYKWIANLIAAKRESEAARSAEILALQHDVTRLREIQVEEQSGWSAKVESLRMEIADDEELFSSSPYGEGLRRALEIMTGGPRG